MDQLLLLQLSLYHLMTIIVLLKIIVIKKYIKIILRKIFQKLAQLCELEVGVNSFGNRTPLDKFMLKNQIGKFVVTPLKSFNKTLALDYDLYPNIKKKWGYGLLINIDPLKERRSEGSGSWAGVLNTYFWIDKKKGIAGTILMQNLPCYDQNALKAFEEFEQILYKFLVNKT